MSRTYKTRLLLHIPINLLEICANLSNDSNTAQMNTPLQVSLA